MTVTWFNSMMHLRASPSRRVSLQVEISSAAHGPTRRPSRNHLCSSGKSVIVILSTALPLRPVHAREQKHLALDSFHSLALREHAACQTQPMSRVTQVLDEGRNAGSDNKESVGMSKCNASIYRLQLGSLVTLLRANPKSAQFVNQSRPWDSHPCGSTVRSSEHPAGFAQDLHNMLALRIVQ